MNQTTTELTSLLRQLSTISPNECRMNDCGEWQILDTETGYWLHLYDAGEIDPFRVMGLVIRRIEARGWVWSMKRVYTGECAVIVRSKGFAGKINPAAALLSAYIVALEASR